MAFVRRANTLLEVNEDAIPRMLDEGFDVVDAGGNVITKSIPHDPMILRNLYKKSLEEIAELKAEIAELKQKPAKAVKEPVKEDVYAESTDEIVKPKKATKKN